MASLTKKQKKFVKEYISNGEIGVQAALEAYDTDSYNTANQIAIENLQRPTIQNAIKSIADRIPDDLLEKVLIEGLGAGKKVFKNNNTSGEVELVGEEPDYAVRHKYLDTSIKLKGYYIKDDPLPTTPNQVQINFNLGEIAKEAEEILRQRKNGIKTE